MPSSDHAGVRTSLGAARRSVLRGALIVASTAAGLVALEGAARVYAVLTHQERGMTFDAELGWRPLPNVRKQGRVWGIEEPASTNSHGWRDAERTYDKPIGLRRAVAIGDSFTFGVDVDDGQRFTDVMPALIDNLEVVNLGVAGFGTDQELRVLETQAFRYDPDVIVLTACVYNDLGDIGSSILYSWPKPTYAVVDGRLQLRRPELTWDIRARTASNLVEAILQRVSDQDSRSRPADGFRSSDGPKLFRMLVREMAAIARSHRVPLVALLAYAPDAIDAHYAEVAATMTASLHDAGIPTLDGRDWLATQSANSQESFFSPGRHHWNARGHQAIAKGLRQLLAKAGVQ